jgi:hypothetical protein
MDIRGLDGGKSGVVEFKSALDLMEWDLVIGSQCGGPFWTERGHRDVVALGSQAAIVLDKRSCLGPQHSRAKNARQLPCT